MWSAHIHDQLQAADPTVSRDCVAGGDGPKAHVLEHMVQQHSLQDRVRLVGAVSHAAVRSFLVQVGSAVPYIAVTPTAEQMSTHEHFLACASGAHTTCIVS